VEGDEIHAHHKPTFQVDERCLPVGCQIMTTLTLELLIPPKRENELMEDNATIVNEKQVPQERKGSKENVEYPTAPQTDKNKQKKEESKESGKRASNGPPLTAGNGIPGTIPKEG